jgi:hypothetical protein
MELNKTTAKKRWALLINYFYALDLSELMEHHCFLVSYIFKILQRLEYLFVSHNNLSSMEINQISSNAFLS